MKKLVTVAALAAVLSGCASMTPNQKKAAVAFGAVVATGVVISASGKDCRVPPEFVGPIKCKFDWPPK